MSNLKIEAETLAFEISSCDEIKSALIDNNHPCHQVISWQRAKWDLKIESIQESPMHRPEAWTGDITKAPIIFISSNPSFDKEENFPSWQTNQWDEFKIIDFALNRFSNQTNRKYGAKQSPNLKDCDKTIGKDGTPSKKRVKYWSWVRKLVSYILEKSEEEVSAINDYVMTEIVHCKSEYEKGVIQARKKCKDKYLERILTLSPARLIIIVGKNAALDMDAIFPGKFPKDWAEINGGFWPKTVRDFPEILRRGLWDLADQKKHSVQIEIGGLERTVIYFAKPGGGGGLYSPWRNPGLISPDLLPEWRKVLNSN